MTTVPGTREREGEHPLERIVGTLVGQTKDRYEPLLALGKAAERRRTRSLPTGTVPRGRCETIRPSCSSTTPGRRRQRPVGGLALRAAGAAKVAIVIIGRHFDRGFRDCETYYQQAKAVNSPGTPVASNLAQAVKSRERAYVDRPEQFCSRTSPGGGVGAGALECASQSCTTSPAIGAAKDCAQWGGRA